MTDSINLLPLFQQLEPYIVSAVGAIIVALSAFIVAVIHKYMGITVDTAMENTMQVTAQNAANKAIAGLEGPIAGLAIKIDSPIVAAGVAYLMTHAPEAVEYFTKTYGWTPKNLQEIILAKLGTAQIAEHTASSVQPSKMALIAAADPRAEMFREIDPSTERAPTPSTDYRTV